MTALKYNSYNVKGKFVLTPATNIVVGNEYVVDNYSGLPAKEKEYSVVIPKHIDLKSNLWVCKTPVANLTVKYDQEDLNEIFMCDITKEGNVSPLIRKHWNRVIDKKYIGFGSIVDCIQKKPIFDVGGKIVSKQCVSCTAWFEATRKQKFCEECNSFRHYVELLPKSKSQNNSKRINYNDFAQAITDAYVEGKTGNPIDLENYSRQAFEKF